VSTVSKGSVTACRAAGPKFSTLAEHELLRRHVLFTP
jgi:hypothetical protein